MKNARILLIVAAPLLLLFGLMGTMRLLTGLDAEAAARDPETPSNSAPPGEAPPPVKRKPADPATQKELERVAAGQLRAIRKGDYADALTFSTPSFREAMTPEQFGSMIGSGYREMTVAIKEKFDQGVLVGEFAHIRAEVTTGDGDRYHFAYDLQNVSGKWAIVGCSPAFPVTSAPPVKSPPTTTSPTRPHARPGAGQADNVPSARPLVPSS